MRIIAGDWGGRKLLAPDGLGTRPMLGRVREAMFSSLGELVCDARILDLFSGTGSLGIEALSRGAEFVRFVERDRGVGRILTKNLTQLGGLDRSELRMGDALSPAQATDGPWDLVFMDPPYPLLRESAGRKQVLGHVDSLMGSALAPHGVLVLHTEPRVLSKSDFQPAWDLRERKYGRTILWYLEKSLEKQREEGMD